MSEGFCGFCGFCGTSIQHLNGLTPQPDNTKEMTMTDATSNPDTREAHVQVLTAEVRTLVVGSRQVTMSVYNQLDNVPPGSVEPFGRVTPKDWTWLFLHVVGRHTATGALVRSYVPRPSKVETLGSEEWARSGRPSYQHWRAEADKEQQRQQLAEVAAQWDQLPLIILAGLR